MESTIEQKNGHKDTPQLVDTNEYRESIKRLIGEEVKNALEDEIRKASQELMEEQRQAVHQVVEELKQAIKQVVDEEKKSIWEKADALRNSIIKFGL